MIKGPREKEIPWTYLNITKAIYSKPIANITLNTEKLKALLLKSGTRQRSQHSMKSLSYSNKTTGRDQGSKVVGQKINTYKPYIQMTHTNKKSEKQHFSVSKGILQYL